jgi:squalene-hopene/tetraprenyl-beta-curcumene cyclase
MLSFKRIALAALVPAALVTAALLSRSETVTARADGAGTAMTGKAVKYLVDHQNKDGSWGPEGKPGLIGMTALAAKALHESGSADAKAAVEKATAFLVKQQQKDGAFTDPAAAGLATYQTAISILCFCSVDRAKYATEIESAKKWLTSSQFSEETKVAKDSPHFGGWGYDHKGEKPDADLSNAQWAIMALKEAGVTKDDPVMKRAIEFVSRCQNNTETNTGVSAAAKLKPGNDGGFFYAPGRPTAKQTKVENADGTVTYQSYASMTYAGLTSLIYAGMDAKDPQVKAALGWIKEHYTLDENYGLGARATDPSAAQQGLYYYYLAFAKSLAAMGQDEIDTKDGKKAWAKDLLAALETRQKPDGSWVNEADRWMESNPVLVTAYGLQAAVICEKHLPK